MKCYPVRVPGCPSAAQNRFKNTAAAHGGNGQFAAGGRRYLMFFIGLVLCAVLLAAPVAADTIDAGSFTSRYTANIHGAATDLSDYQVKFVLYNVTGTDSSENIHLPGITQPTFNEVRFALSDGTSLNYWMETPTGTDNATFWVKMPSIPAGYANTIPVDIYYGNAAIGSAADGAATFPLFDDFTGSSLNTTKWTRVSGTGGTVSNSQLTMTGSTSTILQSKALFFSNTSSLRFRANMYGYQQIIGFRNNSNSNYYTLLNTATLTGSDCWEKFVTMVNSVASSTDYGYWSTDGYRTGELFWNSTYIAFSDGVNPRVAQAGAIPSSLPIFIKSSTSGTTRKGYYDWIFVRQLADSEPAVNEPAAVAATTDLTVTGVSSLVPRSANTVTATIKNLGASDAGAFKANFTLDGTTTTIDISGVAAGNTTTMSVTDPVTTRKYGDTVPLTIQLDTENTITETNETNNTYSTPVTVGKGATYYYGGRYYTGNDLETRNYTEGHVAVLHSWGNSSYRSNDVSPGWYATAVQWTASDLPVPADAKVKAARLYQSYTWNDNGNPGFTVQFNGNTVEQAAFYGDGGENPDYNGQAIYDVTPYFSKDGNTALITASAPKGGIYATVLVVVYEDTGEPYRKIWLDEGCDTLYNSGGTSTDPYIAYAMFGNVTTAGMSSARMTTLLPSGVDNSQSTVIVNTHDIAITGAEGSNMGYDPGYKYYDVTGALQDGTNELGVKYDGSYLNLATAILELTYETPPTASFSANATSGTAPLPILFTDLSYGATGWQWDFNNDGTVDSTEKNPVYTYTSAGTFTVNLTATNAYGSATESKTAYITITGAETTSGPVVAFTASATTGTWPLAVQFTDESAGTVTARSWDFGDYSTPSAEQNPVHTYTTAGTYNVTLSATSAEGTNTTVKKNFVTVSPVTGTRLLLTDAKNGTVSGDLYVGSFQPVPFAAQPTSDDVTVRDFDQRFAIPAFTDIQWARLYVNVYSGSGTANWPSRTTVSLDGNGDGTYETVLGVENMSMSSYSGDGKVYWLNDHTNRVYSDYETEYDVTSRITSTTPSVHVKNEKIGTNYDGRLKAATLVVAYNDGDTDQVRYFVNHGGDWFSSGSSSTTFGTAGIANGFTNATLSNVGLSSSDATYSFNGVSLAGADPVAPINYYENHTWSVKDTVNTAASSVFQYSYVAPSFKTTLATLAIKYPGTAVTAPAASFSANVTSGTVPFAVEFTDASTNSPISWAWDFDNDKTADATTQNATYTFLSAGTYTVNLTATNAAGSSSSLQADYIFASDSSGIVAPVAGFNASATNGLAPVSATCNDTSTNTPTAWKWESRIADNGTWAQFSTEKNTTYSFATAGTYDIRLTATNAGGSNTLTKTHVFAVATAHDYLTTVSSGTVSGDLYVNSVSPWATTNTTTFTLPATAVGNVQWARLYVTSYAANAAGTHGLTSTVVMDGTTLGTETLNVGADKNGNAYPVNDHVMKVYSDYEAVYDVTDRIASASPTVTVTNTVLPGYTFDGKIKGITLVVAYNDGDSGVVKYFVNHGNDWMGPAGTGSSTTFDTSSLASGWTNAELKGVAFSSSDATYTFPASGSNITPTSLGSSSYWKYNSFDVTGNLTPGPSNTFGFTATGTSFKTTLATLVVKYTTGGTPSAPVATFLTTVTAGPAPLSVQFTDQSATSPTAWSWDFNNDGTVDSTEQSPTFSYTTAGAYTVKLTVTNASGSSTITKPNVIAVSDGPKRLTTVQSGTVSGDLYVGAYQPVAWSSQSTTPGLRTFTQAYTIPAHTDIQWARLYAAVYAASTNNRAGQAVVSFDGNGDGTYETALGTETLAIPATSVADVYPVSDHVNRQYSDYLIWYDVTPYINANSVNAQIVTQNLSSDFDGRLKTLTLVVAYNDGDSDQVQYWVNDGHDYQTSSGSAVTTTFATGSLASGWTNATLKNVGLSSQDAIYTFNGNTLARQGSGLPSFAVNEWNASALMNAGSDTSFTYLHNTSSSYKTILATLAVESASGTPPSAAPVAGFTASPVSGTAPLTVTFTDSSTNTPTAWLWNFGDSNTTNATVKNPVHTYTAAGTYTVNLTATNALGSDYELKTGHVTVSSAGTNDLSITGTVETVPSVAVFAKEPNAVTIPGITNTGTATLTNIKVALYASDVSSTVPVNITTIPSLAGSGTTDLSVTDPTVRNLEGGTVTYTAKVDPDNLVAETSETNNAAASNEKPVKYNGYKGKLYWEGGSNITTRVTYDFNGGMIYSTQPSTAYKAEGWSTRTETWGAGDLSLPGNATIENVFLYISYNWDRTSGGVPDWTAKFNDNTLSGGTLYTDKSNFGGYANYMYGLYRYDVTSRFSTGGNSLVMTRGAGKNALYPSTLVIIYSDPSATRKQIFINEECDELLYSEVTYGTTLEEATAYAPFTGMTIDTGDVRNATLYSFAGSAGPDEGNLFFNGNLVGTNAWQGTASTASAQSFDVKSALAESGNEAAIQGTTSGGMDALQQILVVEYTPSVTVPVAAFTANVTSGNAELAVKFTDRTKGTPTSWAWDFGDGSTSTEKNPIHTYGAVGTYTVRLTATNALGTNSMEKAGYITATLGAPIAAFNAAKTAGDTPFTAQFTDQSARLPSSWTWDFGDSDTTNATKQNPVHTYRSAGSYTVKLTAGNTAGSNTATRTGYINVNAKVIVEKEFNLAGVVTEAVGGSQNVSIDTSQVAVSITGSVVTIEGIGNGWSRMDLTMNDTPEIGTSTVNGTITEVKAVGQNITVPIPAVGSPKVHLELALDELPSSGASITETITKDPTAGTTTSFTLAATTNGKNIDEIAYTVNFTKNGGIKNAGDGGIIRNATVYFSISPAWVAAHGGTSKIVILHMNEAGLSTLLPTTYLGLDEDGNDLFSAVSEEGLSTFALAAVSPVSTITPTQTPTTTTTTSSSPSSDSSSSSGGSSGSSKTTTDNQKGKVYDYAQLAPSNANTVFKTTTVSAKGRVSVTPLIIETESMPGAKASWSAEIVSDPDGGGKISTGLISTIPDTVIASYRTVLAGQDLDVSSVAYAMSVEKGDTIGATKDGIIEMTAPQKWVTDNGGISQIRVFRVSDEGVAELLTTAFSKYDQDTGYLTFRAESPTGLCTFTLMAVKPTTGGSTAAQVSTGVQQLVPTETTAAPATGPETTPSLPLPALIVAVAGIVIVIMGVVIGKRWWERRQNPTLFRED